MQQLRDTPETTAPTAPVYNSATVREVLARASKIEQETQAEAPMTAMQIETLGKELGLSADAVRRALGETVGAAPATVANHKVGLPPVTRADVLNAGKNAFAYSTLAAMSLFVMTVGTHYFEFFQQSPWILYPSILYVILSVLFFGFGSFVLPFTYGWRRKDWRQGVLLSAAIVPMYAVTLGIAVVMMQVAFGDSSSIDWQSGWNAAVFSPILGTVGGVAGRWWYERKLAEER